MNVPRNLPRRAVALGALGALAVAGVAPAAADPAPPAPRRAGETPQRVADRHFKRGVALFGKAQYAAALAEFERAYEVAPHPLVLFNLAACHRELGDDDARAAALQRLLVDGPGKVAPSLLAEGRAELDALRARTAWVRVTVSPPVDDAAVLVDGVARSFRAHPLVLAPGRHALLARAAGRPDAARTLDVAAGQEVAVELVLAEPARGAVDPALRPTTEGSGPALAPPSTSPVLEVRDARPRAERPWLAVHAGLGTNLRRVGHTGAPTIGLAAELGGRLAVAVDVVVVAYAVVPSLRVRLVGDTTALYALGAVPVAFSSDPMVGRFAAIAGGLGVRYRATPHLAARAEAYVSAPGKGQDTTLPVFVGGEVWF